MGHWANDAICELKGKNAHPLARYQKGAPSKSFKDRPGAVNIKRTGHTALGTSAGRSCGAGASIDCSGSVEEKPVGRNSEAGGCSKEGWVIDDEEITSESSGIDLGVLTSVVWNDDSEIEELRVETIDGKPVSGAQAPSPTRREACFLMLDGCPEGHRRTPRGPNQFRVEHERRQEVGCI